MAQNRHWEQDKEATVYIGNIDERASPAMVYEIMVQMGPIHNIYMPRDRVTQNHQGFGFVEFRTPADAEYAANVMNGIKLYGKSLRVNKASADKQKQAEVGAELFIGNLDPTVDERTLYDTFSRFGPLLTMPKVAREDNGTSKGFGFISYADFDSSDAAVANLNGQYILSKEVAVQYAFKKDGKGERHGDKAERELAAQAKKRNILPELQPVPPAFLASSTPAAAVPPAQSPAATAPPPAGFDPGSGHPLQRQPMPAPGMPAGFAPPPRGPSPYNVVPSPQGLGGGPPAPYGRGGVPLPPPPSGLPARPPQAQRAYPNPADFHPGSQPVGFRPPGGPPGAPPGAAPGTAPPVPPGFGGAPPAPGLANGPPGPTGTPPAPPGFMPPPGFNPPGYPRR
ncbi:RNA-binding domain-containing protein [Sodiomyces alkalinus F11]|uniref:RNA-binding domain-containing protein n=1 Tax=Sodiomyces alkalinus (strain CBS 110278 / VKM F-3762 / F11) TaxID=1314773 RepID=A0A3N2PXB2_SODAK|nr:RNA-binding domain-containing protein [Sodiomyces alkalinus F11]ROT39170.1 RNA-binding domain-containing protein [Sodiomyces alkalinus F11]